MSIVKNFFLHKYNRNFYELMQVAKNKPGIDAASHSKFCGVRSEEENVVETHKPSIKKLIIDKTPSCNTCIYYIDSLGLCERFYTDFRICRYEENKCGLYARYYVNKKSGSRYNIEYKTD